jgi:hypothetical protein
VNFTLIPVTKSNPLFVLRSGGISAAINKRCWLLRSFLRLLWCISLYSALFFNCTLLERSAEMLGLAPSTDAYKQIVWERISTSLFDIVPS